MNSPWLSFSGTGSAPRESTQQGTLPLGNWYGANHSMSSRHGLRLADAQQGRGGERAVADPGAGVGAGARLDGGAVAIDQDMGDGGPEGLDERVRGGGQADIDAVEALVPVAGGGGEGACRNESALPSSPMERHQEIHRPFSARSEIQIPRQGARRIAERIARAPPRELSLPQMLRRSRRRRTSWRRRRTGGSRESRCARRSPWRRCRPRRSLGWRDASRGIEELGGRVHLEGPEGEEQPRALRLSADCGRDSGRGARSFPAVPRPGR